MRKIKKWNWSILVLTICMCEIGAMKNKNIEHIGAALLFGLIGGLIFGLPLAIITKDVE